MSFDIVIKNGKIVDGAGNPWYHADVVVKDSIIVGTRFLLTSLNVLNKVEIN